MTIGPPRLIDERLHHEIWSRISGGLVDANVPRAEQLRAVYTITPTALGDVIVQLRAGDASASRRIELDDPDDLAGPILTAIDETVVELVGLLVEDPADA